MLNKIIRKKLSNFSITRGGHLHYVYKHCAKFNSYLVLYLSSYRLHKVGTIYVYQTDGWSGSAARSAFAIGKPGKIRTYLKNIVNW